MKTLITLTSIVDNYLNDSSRHLINELLAKHGLVGKFYELIKSRKTDDDNVSAVMLGYPGGKDKGYIMLKKRLREFLEKIIRVGVADASEADKLNGLLQLVRILFQEGQMDEAHEYCKKAISIAKANCYLESWLECLKIDCSYYQYNYDIESMERAEGQIEKLTKDIALLNEINFFIQKERLIYDMQWGAFELEDRSANIDLAMSRFGRLAENHEISLIRIAYIMAQVFVAVRNLRHKEIMPLIMKAFYITCNNRNMNPYYSSMMYTYLCAGYYYEKKAEKIMEMINDPAFPDDLRLCVFAYKLLIYLFFERKLYDDACNAFITFQQKVPIEQLSNMDKATIFELSLSFKIWYFAGKLTQDPTATYLTDEVEVFLLNERKRGLSDHKLILLLLAVVYAYNNKLSAAILTIKKAERLLLKRKFSEILDPLKHMILAVSIFINCYPKKELIEQKSGIFIQAFRDCDDDHNHYINPPFFDIWELLMAKLM